VCKALAVCILENVDLIAVVHISATNYGVDERRSNNYAFTRLVLESMYYILLEKYFLCAEVIYFLETPAK
jgi:hypothetical protein